jgi:hypothetical protein
MEAIIISLSPPPGRDYSKTAAGQRAVMADFEADKPFTHGVAFVDRDPKLITRSDIYQQLGEAGVTTATIIVYNRHKSEVVKIDIKAEVAA